MKTPQKRNESTKTITDLYDRYLKSHQHQEISSMVHQPEKRSLQSPLKRELRKLNDVWTKQCKNVKAGRHLRSGFCIKNETNTESNTDDFEKKVKSERKGDKKGPYVLNQLPQSTEVQGSVNLNDDSSGETFLRRRKLRSEVSQDELWEGFFDFRFKRLNPLKVQKDTFNDGKDSDNKTVPDTSTDIVSDIECKERLINAYSTNDENCEKEEETTKKTVEIIQYVTNDTSKHRKTYRKARSVVDFFEELLHKEKSDNTSGIDTITFEGGNDGRSFSNVGYITADGHSRKLHIDATDENTQKTESSLVWNAYNVIEKNLEFSEHDTEFVTNIEKEVKALISSLVTTVVLQHSNKHTEIKPSTHQSHLQDSSSCKTSLTPKRSARLYEKRYNTPEKLKSSIYVYTPIKKHEETKVTKKNSSEKNAGKVKIYPSNTQDTKEISSEQINETHNDDTYVKIKKRDDISVSCTIVNNCCEAKIGNIDDSTMDHSQTTVTSCVCNTDDKVVLPKDTRSPLKIIVKKTENGAAVISIPSPNNTSFENDLSNSNQLMYSRFKVQKARTLTTKIKSNIERIETTARNAADINGQDKITPSHMRGDKKQTRSKTNSGNRENCKWPDPEQRPKLYRSKGKVVTVSAEKPRMKVKMTKRKLSVTPDKTNNKKKTTFSLKCKQSRKSTEDKDLLQNQCVAKHACVLWSSEQRRHFKLSHSHLSHTEIDDVMRKAWVDLPDKEKIKYFQRAHIATKDENKHSTASKHKHDESDVKASKALKKFTSLKIAEQDEELKKWLRMLNEVSTIEYKQFMKEFRETLKEDRENRKDRHRPAVDMQERYRKLLFQAILDKMDTIMDLYNVKKERQKQLIKSAFNTNIQRILHGDLPLFSSEVHSEKLSEVLLDIKSLENDMKLTVSGTALHSQSYDDILESLDDYDSMHISDLDVHDKTGSNIVNDVPDAASEEMSCMLSLINTYPLPELCPREIDEYFSADIIQSSPLSPDKAISLANQFEKDAVKEFNSANDDETYNDKQSSILTSLLFADELRQYKESPYSIGSLIDVGSLTMYPIENHTLKYVIHTPPDIGPQVSTSCIGMYPQPRLTQINMNKGNSISKSLSRVIHAMPTVSRRGMFVRQPLHGQSN